MQTRHLSALMRDDLTTLRVTFNTQSTGVLTTAMPLYTYKVLREDAARLKLGGIVVVPYQKKTAEEVRQQSYSREVDLRQARADMETNFRLAKIVEIHDNPEIDVDATFDYKWIVGPISFDRYNAVVEHDAVLQDTFVKLETEVKKETYMDRYRNVLANNPALKERVDALRKGPLALQHTQA